MNSQPAGSGIGRVVRADAKLVHVAIDARVIPCVPRGKLFEDLAGRKNPLAVGDWVRLDSDCEPAGIAEVLPRRNYLGRIASMHDPREQVLFANVDQLLVVAAIKQPIFSSLRVDRILSACCWHDIPAILVVNKCDLDKKRSAAKIEATYRQAGYDVVMTSARTGSGVREVRDRIHGKTSALYGGSGVGKSSLLNALEPTLGLTEGQVSAYWDSGKHTTSHSRWIELPELGAVIDTPGVRNFRAHGMGIDHLRGSFPEFAGHSPNCRFPDCSHDHEPSCAVFEAVEQGHIAPSRYASYVALLDEIRNSKPSAQGSDDADFEAE